MSWKSSDKKFSMLKVFFSSECPMIQKPPSYPRCLCLKHQCCFHTHGRAFKMSSREPSQTWNAFRLSPLRLKPGLLPFASNVFRFSHIKWEKLWTQEWCEGSKCDAIKSTEELLIKYDLIEMFYEHHFLFDPQHILLNPHSHKLIKVMTLTVISIDLPLWRCCVWQWDDLTKSNGKLLFFFFFLSLWWWCDGVMCPSIKCDTFVDC